MTVELLYPCKKCKLTLNHKAVAMTQDKIEKIQCNTCKTVTKYKEPTKKKAAAVKIKIPSTTKSFFTQEELNSFSQKEVLNYEMRKNYNKGDLIFHSNFGDGIVTKTESDKITVKFQEEGVKMLAHNYGQL